MVHHKFWVIFVCIKQISATVGLLDFLCDIKWSRRPVFSVTVGLLDFVCDIIWRLVVYVTYDDIYTPVVSCWDDQFITSRCVCDLWRLYMWLMTKSRNPTVVEGKHAVREEQQMHTGGTVVSLCQFGDYNWGCSGGIRGGWQITIGRGWRVTVWLQERILGPSLLGCILGPSLLSRSS